MSDYTVAAGAQDHIITKRRCSVEFTFAALPSPVERERERDEIRMRVADAAANDTH